MTKALRLTTALAIALLLSVLATPSATADGGTPITRFHAEVRLAEDGLAEVTVDFTMDFSAQRGRGPIYVLPTRQDAGNGKDYRFSYGPVEWSSPSGANTDVRRTASSKTMTMQVGDADTFYDTPQEYRLTYTVSGLIAPDHPESGLDEFNWDAIGTGWDLPFSDATATVTGPVDVAASYCHFGARGDRTCEASHDGAGADFSVDHLDPHERFQVTASFPAGTFVGAEQELVDKPASERPFTLNAATGAVSGGLLLAAAGILWALWRNASRDEVFVGVPPGVIPKGGEATVARASRRDRPPVAVQFAPPPGSPGELRVLIKGSVDKVAASATLVDLAARGYLTIESTGSGVVLTRVDPAPTGKLLGHEQSLLAVMFKQSARVTAKDLRANRKLGRRVVKALDGAVKGRGWIEKHSHGRLQAMRIVGFFLTFIGVAMCAMLGMLFGFGLVGIPVALFGIGLFVVSFKTFRRTAKGSAVLAQAEGFKLYLSTAERDTLRFEEGVDIFSRYLPYAMVFGVADHWSSLFADLARDGVYVGDTSWLHGVQLSQAAGLTSALGSVSSAMTTVTQMAVASGVGVASGGSTGGSGSGGGGGFGGSGGSSW